MRRRAVISAVGGPLKIVEDLVPAVPDEGAVVKTSYAGVCRSDIHLMNDSDFIREGEVFRLRDVIGDGFFNVTLGHEICGVVTEIGPKAKLHDSDVKVGDRVCVYPWIGCQKCEMCVHGMNNMCEFNLGGGTELGQKPSGDGGYSTHLAVPLTRYLFKVPNNVPMSIACMLPCSASTVYGSLLRATPQIERDIRIFGDASLLLIGAGGLGLWGVQLAKKALFVNQPVRVIVADVTEEKVKLAMAAGADDYVIWHADDTLDQLVAVTTKKGGKKLTAAINYVGDVKTSDVALRSLRKGGVLVLIGMAGGELPVSIVGLAACNQTVVGSRTASQRELRETIDIVAQTSLDYPNIEEYKLDEINGVFDKLKNGQVRGRAVITFD